MPTIYEYLNSISDLLVPMQQRYGTIDLWCDLNSSENYRYTVVIKHRGENVFGWGIGPAAAYDDAMKRVEEGNAEREIRERHRLLAEQEIRALNQ